LPRSVCVLGNSRTEMSDDEWRDHLAPSVRKHATGFDESRWREFASRLHYLSGSATKPDLYPVLIKRIHEFAVEHGTITQEQAENAGATPFASQANILFYLSVAPQLYAPIIDQIGASGMVYEGKRWCALDPSSLPWQRIIVEKPF